MKMEAMKGGSRCEECGSLMLDEEVEVNNRLCARCTTPKDEED